MLCYTISHVSSVVSRSFKIREILQLLPDFPGRWTPCCIIKIVREICEIGFPIFFVSWPTLMRGGAHTVTSTWIPSVTHTSSRVSSSSTSTHFTQRDWVWHLPSKHDPIVGCESICVQFLKPKCHSTWSSENGESDYPTP